jgi:hypothetical protein
MSVYKTFHVKTSMWEPPTPPILFENLNAPTLNRAMTCMMLRLIGKVLKALRFESITN